MKPRTRWEFIVGWVILSAVMVWSLAYLPMRIILSVLLSGITMVYLARQTWIDYWFKKTPKDAEEKKDNDGKIPKP
jgi:hypothetical protein